MKRIVVGLLILLVGSVLLNLKLLKKDNADSYKVTEVIDGDTFRIDFEGGKRVRLMGIDAPEMGRCLSTESRDKLISLILDKQVSLTDNFIDPYGRIMANVFVGDEYINKTMLGTGLGRMDYQEQPRRDELKEAYQLAVKQQIGVHGDQCVVTKSECKIKANIDNENKKLYYRLDCRGYGNVTVNTAFGDAWFCSETEATMAGFLKASGCK